jgi:hypothetical protein
MEPLAIAVWRYHKKEDWARDFVSRAIVFFTGMPYTHVALVFEGAVYESTVWKNEKGNLESGIRITYGRFPSDVPEPDICMVPWRLETTPERMDRIKRELEKVVPLPRPYNILKLVVLALIWPTRRFWKWIKWVPFNHEAWGEVCSGFVDEIMKDSKWDLFPDEWEGYTVPGQFIDIPGWVCRKCDDDII